MFALIKLTWDILYHTAGRHDCDRRCFSPHHAHCEAHKCQLSLIHYFLNHWLWQKLPSPSYNKVKRCEDISFCFSNNIPTLGLSGVYTQMHAYPSLPQLKDHRKVAQGNMRLLWLSMTILTQSHSDFQRCSYSLTVHFCPCERNLLTPSRCFYFITILGGLKTSQFPWAQVA